MSNIEQDQIYLNIAKEYSNFSKCQFTKVGAVAVNERGRIIGTGVNGTIVGTKNCSEHIFDNRDQHVDFTKEHEIHAEANLILDLAKSGIKFSELSIYLTISPCEECFKLLLGLNDYDRIKVKKIVYSEKYHRISDDQLKRMASKAADIGTCFYKYKF